MAPYSEIKLATKDRNEAKQEGRVFVNVVSFKYIRYALGAYINVGETSFIPMNVHD